MVLSNLSLLLFAVLTALALAVLLGVLGLWRRTFGRRAAARRAAEVPPLILRQPRTGLPLTSLDAEPADIEGDFARLVGDSDLAVRPLEVVLILIACSALAGGLSWLANDDALLGLLAALAVVGLLLPLLLYRRARRRMSLREQLPLVLDLMARAVRAGQSLDQAVELIGEQSPQPWGPQFRIGSRQLHAGLSVRAVFAAMWRRTRIPEMQDLVTVLTVHRQTGGNLSVMLERLAANARDRLDFLRQFRSATSGARYATVLMIAAWTVAFVFYFVFDNDYSRQFLQKPEGVTMILAAFGLMALGLWWIMRVLRVDY